MSFPGHSLSLIVKATFDISPGSPAAIASEQMFPTGDVPYQDDDTQEGGPRYESDFAYFKPRADVLLVGTCYAPGGTPTQTCQVTTRVGGRSKTMIVVGDRKWERTGLSWKPTEPKPFLTMPLRYEHSFGGGDSAQNPVGSGGHVVLDESGEEVRPLPNLEDPHALITSRRSRPDPAGFGPLNRAWEMRTSKTGTYKGKYLKTRWPWFPEDFDWSYFNAAPEDMQVDGYLRGDEELYFENLHPVHSGYESRLPGLRVRCFVNRLATQGTGPTEFVEVSMNLDTLWVDMETETLILVWRGWTAVASEDHEDVQDVFLMSETLDQQPASGDECHRAFVAKQAEEEEGFEPELVATADESPAEDPRADALVGPDPAAFQAEANALLAQLGIDVEALPPEAREQQSRLVRRLSETDPRKVADSQHQAIAEQMRAALAKLDLDPDHLPPLSAKAKAEQFRFMKELGIKDPHLADPELTSTWAIITAVMSKGGIDPENLDPLIAQAKKMNLQAGGEQEEDQAAADSDVLTREAVVERAGRGASFAGEDLHGLDLSELDLEGLDFTGANLAGAKLTKAGLTGAILVTANLEGADLTGADLTTANLAGVDLTSARLDEASFDQADITRGNLTGASLIEATLTDASFEQAQMTGAVCNQTNAVGAIFVEADLTEATFRDSDCSGADFSRATLDRAAFSRAKLVATSFEEAVARQIRLADTDITALKAGGGGDFTGGVFWRASGEGSIWEEADLTGTDFRGARMPGTLFTGACLKQANFQSSDLRGSRFTKANLREAQLVRMNLFQGSLERADLTGADLSGSNLYEVEFLNAVTAGTLLTGTNLKMTKLEA